MTVVRRGGAANERLDRKGSPYEIVRVTLLVTGQIIDDPDEPWV